MSAKDELDGLMEMFRNEWRFKSLDDIRSRVAEVLGRGDAMDRELAITRRLLAKLGMWTMLGWYIGRRRKG